MEYLLFQNHFQKSNFELFENRHEKKSNIDLVLKIFSMTSQIYKNIKNQKFGSKDITIQNKTERMGG